MKTHHHYFFCLAIAVSASFSLASTPLAEFETIHYRESKENTAKRGADLLKNILKRDFGAILPASNRADLSGAGIYVGREAALATGLITESELSTVKNDGYIVRAKGDRIALCGYAPPGDLYAVYHLLRHLGIHFYPDGNDAFKVTKELRKEIDDFELVEVPFFDLRDVRGHIGGYQFRATQRQFVIGDPKAAYDVDLFKGRGYMGWDHTSAYLVPQVLYYESNPEYFALKGGKRIPDKTEHNRVTLCMSNPAVHKIAAERAVKWVDGQSSRRLFVVTGGDASPCQCVPCAELTPRPNEHADRQLRWCNSVATAVKSKFPDVRLLWNAYISTVKPPTNVRPEPNIIVMYCPWYWDSRYTSAVTWEHPTNSIAMKEFVGWNVAAPGQVGVYDYPSGYTLGCARRIKSFAKYGVRIYYSNNTKGARSQWVATQLLWDPYLDTQALSDDVIRANYGPALQPMSEFYRLDDEAHIRHGRAAIRMPEYTERIRQLLREAEPLMQDENPRVEARMLRSLFQHWGVLLVYTHPFKAKQDLRAPMAVFREDLSRYLHLHERILHNLEIAGSGYPQRQHIGTFKARMETLGVKVTTPRLSVELLQGAIGGVKIDAQIDNDDEGLGDDDDDLAGDLGGLAEKDEAADHEKILDLLMARFAKDVPEIKNYPSGKKPDLRPIDSAEEAGKWTAELVKGDGVSALPTKWQPETDTSLSGVSVTAPLSNLPSKKEGAHTAADGLVRLRRAHSPAVDLDGALSIAFWITASTTVPVTLRADTVELDVHLHPGEQIVRIDLRHHFDLDAYTKMDATIDQIGLDIWPQNSARPFVDDVKDATVTLHRVAFEDNGAPQHEALKGKAIWLTQFRPNVSHEPLLPELALPDGDSKPVRHRARFRSFTTDRTLSPIRAIVADVESAEQMAAVKSLQESLASIYGVTLPINPDGVVAGPDTGNAIVIGRNAALATQVVTTAELDFVGKGGFVINARDGRIVIAGHDAAGSINGMGRYLQDHDVVFTSQGVRMPKTPASPFLHELYSADWPHFKNVPISPVWQMPWTKHTGGTVSLAEQNKARALATTIKNASRAKKTGEADVFDGTIPDSPLARHVAARLFWDPFASYSDLLREFTSKPAKLATNR